MPKALQLPDSLASTSTFTIKESVQQLCKGSGFSISPVFRTVLARAGDGADRAERRVLPPHQPRVRGQLRDDAEDAH